MKKYLFFQFLLLLAFDLSIAQTTGLSNIIPPSPNASSLAQYADVPVSNYTGVPNISIPLTNVKSGKIELPVNLSYHASGIKVMQEASWVGLGWALNAGGVITREVRGLDDFDLQDGYLLKELPPATANNLPDWSDPTRPLPNTYNFQKYYEYYLSIQSEHLDPEPDVFYYNFMQYSGKLIFEKQTGNIVNATSVDQNNLIFSYNKTTKVWIVTDGNGWKYYLGSKELNAIEVTTSSGYSSDVPVVPTNGKIGFSDDAKLIDSAWYLTKVVSPEGDEINFSYDSIGNTLSQINRSELFHDQMGSFTESLGGFSGHSSILQGRYKQYSVNQQIINPVYLKKIKFPSGYLEFLNEDRDDLQTLNSNDPKPKRLKSVKLFDLQDKLVKQFNLGYSYSSTRLRLDTIKESTVNESNQVIENPPYILSYNQTQLPDKTSYAIDYWGYYNGKPNDAVADYPVYSADNNQRITLIELITPANSTKMLSPFYEGSTNNNVYLTGADRRVDESKMQASILKSIQYPTGGIVNFEYEANDYYDEKSILYDDEKISESVLVSYNEALVYKEKSFVLDKLTRVHLSFRIINLSSTNINENMITGLDDGNGKNVVIVAPWLSQNPNKTLYNADIEVFLPPGTYKLKARNNTNSSVRIIAAADYIKKIPTNKKKGAGLRIKSITTTDGSKFVKQKKYTYESNNISTGRLISPYQFFYNITLIASNIETSQSLIFSYMQAAGYLVRASDSAVPFGNSAQGNVIGYDQVIVSDLDSTNSSNLGTSKYFYRNKEEMPAEMFLPGVPNLVNLSNGQLLKETHFNLNGDKVKEKSIDYILENTRKKIKGVKLYNIMNSTNTEVRFYDTYSEWWHPKNTTETIYDLKGLNPITMTTNYNYENPLHKNLTKTTTINSKGETIKTTNKYPSDLVTGIDETSAATISNMISNNVINPIIKSETTVNDVVVQSNLTNYNQKTHTDTGTNLSNNMYLTKNFKVLKKGTTANYDEKVQFVAYDNNGHILQEQKTNGSPVCYIWGYKNEYPIAKIENATYSEIATALGISTGVLETYNENNLVAINNLRNTLPNAMVTTFTYIPLVGVSTITDSKGDIITYTYDSFGRLQFVKDKDGNILSENQYHYKQ